MTDRRIDGCTLPWLWFILRLSVIWQVMRAPMNALFFDDTTGWMLANIVPYADEWAYGLLAICLVSIVDAFANVPIFHINTSALAHLRPGLYLGMAALSLGAITPLGRTGMLPTTSVIALVVSAVFPLAVITVDFRSRLLYARRSHATT